MHACMQLTPSDTVVVMAQVPDEGLATLDEAPASLSRAESDPTSLAFVPAAPVTPIDMYDEAPCHTLRCHTALSGTYVSRDGVVEVRMKHIMCYLRLWSESMQQSFALQLHAACVIDSHRRPLKRVLGPHLPEPRKSFYAPSRSSAQISWRQSAPKLRTALKRCTRLNWTPYCCRCTRRRCSKCCDGAFQRPSATMERCHRLGMMACPHSERDIEPTTPLDQIFAPGERGPLASTMALVANGLIWCCSLAHHSRNFSLLLCAANSGRTPPMRRTSVLQAGFSANPSEVPRTPKDSRPRSTTRSTLETIPSSQRLL